MHPFLKKAVYCLICCSAVGSLYSQTPSKAWTEHGLKASEYEKLTKIMKKHYDKKDVFVGAIVVLSHRGKIVFNENIGYANRSTKVPFTATRPISIASITKAMSGTAITRMAQEGLVDLEKPIDYYIPRFTNIRRRNGNKLSRMPTVKEFMDHTSGIDNSFKPWNNKSNRGKTLDEIMDLYIKNGFPRDPGTKYEYSGGGIDILWRACEVATGKFRDELFMEHLSDFIGIKATYYPDSAMRNSLEKRYSWKENDSAFKSYTPALSPPWDKPWGTYSSSGGAVISSPLDIIKWLQVLKDDGVVDGKTYIEDKWLRKMWTPEKPSIRGMAFSLNKSKTPGYPLEISHGGSTGTSAFLRFNEDVIAVIFTQSGDASKPFRSEMRSEIIDIFKDLKKRGWPEIPDPVSIDTESKQRRPKVNLEFTVPTVPSRLKIPAPAITGTIYMQVHTLAGQHIRTLEFDTGHHSGSTIHWDGKLINGTLAPKGLYIIRINSGKAIHTNKIWLH